MRRPETVVTLRALGLGDFLTAVPALRALKKAFPDARHLLAMPSTLSGVSRLAGLDAEILDTKELSPLPNVLKAMSGLVAVDLHGNGPQSHRVLLDIGPDELIAFRNSEIGNPGPVWDEREHEVERWCRLLEASGIEADPTQLTVPVPDCPLPPGVEGATVIHPGAKHEARQWPIERWATVAHHLADVGDEVIVTGSVRERPRAIELAKRSGLAPASVAAGTTDLMSLASIVAAARLVICGDTGVAHLATALRTPSVVLFGPTDPAIWGPPRRGPHVVIWKGATGDPHADTPDEGLLSITPAEVIAAAMALRVGQPAG